MQLSGKGAQTPSEDDRNREVLLWLNGKLLSRAHATVSIFDAGFGLGDGIWEGIRLVEGKLLFLDEHLDRLLMGAKAIALDIGLDKAGLAEVIKETIKANGMHDGVHIRLMVTRGEKTTIHQDPRNAMSRPTIAVVAEYKLPDPEIKLRGLKLATSPIRCSGPDVFDMRLNSHSRLNLIQALLHAIAAGADEALMLDPHGFVSSCNSTNFFIVKNGEVLTSRGGFCFNGITRQKVLFLCRRNNIAAREADFSLQEVYNADEAFVSGTFGGLTRVASIDGRQLPSTENEAVLTQLTGLYEELVRS